MQLCKLLYDEIGSILGIMFQFSMEGGRGCIYGVHVAYLLFGLQMFICWFKNVEWPTSKSYYIILQDYN